MATYKSVQESSKPPTCSGLECDICSSEDIVDTKEGYVCRNCGIVLEVQKLQYDKPYNADLVQHARGLGATKIGTKRERWVSPNSSKLVRLNKQNSIKESEKAILDEAISEISRLFSALDLSSYEGIKDMVLSKFTEIRPKLRSGTKHRNVKKLIAIITYFCLKFRNVPVNQHDLIGASDFTRKEFNDFMLRIQQYLPEYVDRNRQYYIAQRIFEITEHFNLEMPYYFLAKKVMNELWDGIKNTTDNVVTGLVCSISALCSCRDKVSVNSICKRLGIRMSTVQVQVRKKIFDRFRVKGFVSLIKSSDLLIKIMEKLGLSGEHEGEPQEGVATIGRVEIILGSASEVFNSHDNVDYYYFVVKGEGKAPLVMTLKINNLPLNFEIDWRQEDIQVGKLLNFEVYRNFALKDPPLVDA